MLLYSTPALLMQSHSVAGPFFGFMGAAAALVFACKSMHPQTLLCSQWDSLSTEI